MEVLKDMFPKMSDANLQIALSDCGDDLEAGTILIQRNI